MGLDLFLRDLGWNTVKVTRGMSGDKVLNSGKGNDYVLISSDKRLLDRSRLQGIRTVDVGMTDLGQKGQ